MNLNWENEICTHKLILLEKKNKAKLSNSRKQLDILLNLLSYADKEHDIIDVALKSGFEIEEIAEELKKAINHKLIKI